MIGTLEGPQIILGFVGFGLALNAGTFVLAALAVMFKFREFTPEERATLYGFLERQRWFIESNVDPKRYRIHSALWFLPTYSAWIQMVLTFYVLKAKDPKGMILALKKSNDFKFFKIINYQMLGVRD